jgi:hypothetical protein
MGHDPKLKLTQTIVGTALRRTPDGKFAPKAPLRDHEVGGLLLVIGARTAIWCVDYKPRGRREDGRRHSKVRMTLGDAATMPLSDARTAARAIKVEVAQGRDPHAEKRARRAKAIAERAIKATTLAEALEGYEKTCSSAASRQRQRGSKKSTTRGRLSPGWKPAPSPPTGWTPAWSAS